MKQKKLIKAMIPLYILAAMIMLGIGLAGSRSVTALSEAVPMENRVCVIIDAGHGGEDGGASSSSGTLESDLNLQIALRLEDLLHLLGYDTLMIRRTDISVYTSGQTLSQKKVSDLKERVRIINETKNAVLISIHQNYFPESKYSGAQVFYAKTEGSSELANTLQKNLVCSLNEGSNRKSKEASGIYLMEKIKCTGILVECGFLSNPEEEALLKNQEYQKKLCCVLGVSLSNYLDG